MVRIQRVNISEVIRTTFLAISVAVAVGCDGSVGDAWSSLAAYFEALGPSAASSGFPKQQSIVDNAYNRSSVHLQVGWTMNHLHYI
jgi:hypothetical protein